MKVDPPPKQGEPAGLSPWRERTDLSWIVDVHFPSGQKKVGHDGWVFDLVEGEWMNPYALH